MNLPNHDFAGGGHLVDCQGRAQEVVRIRIGPVTQPSIGVGLTQFAARVNGIFGAGAGDRGPELHVAASAWKYWSLKPFISFGVSMVAGGEPTGMLRFQVERSIMHLPFYRRKRRSMECAPHHADGSSVLLVVDDYPENLVSMRALLQREDWRVITAGSGLEALELLLAHDVDLVLLDVRMPGMDGFEVARLMRGSQRTCMTPIIFLTANAQSPRQCWRALLEHQRNRRALQRLSHDLESARAFNASVLDNAAEGILVVGEGSVIEYANPAISRLLNATMNELQGESFLSFPAKTACTGLAGVPDVRGLSQRRKPGVSTTLFYAPVAVSRYRWRCHARRCPPSRRPWW
ncbi:response regulator receiver domain-containing protein [Ditylenchus destructor]|nr:response regulator receiver domain-containing protein [Ditylenchus destructor]